MASSTAVCNRSTSKTSLKNKENNISTIIDYPCGECNRCVAMIKAILCAMISRTDSLFQTFKCEGEV